MTCRLLGTQRQLIPLSRCLVLHALSGPGDSPAARPRIRCYKRSTCMSEHGHPNWFPYGGTGVNNLFMARSELWKPTSAGTPLSIPPRTSWCCVLSRRRRTHAIVPKSLAQISSFRLHPLQAAGNYATSECISCNPLAVKVFEQPASFV